MKKILKWGCISVALIILFLLIGLWYLLSPRDVSKMNPRDVFERYVYSPIPGSVKISSCTGVLALAGRSVRISFAIDKNDFQKILNGYKKVDSIQEDIIPEEAKKKLGKMIFYQKQSDSGIIFWTIITDESNSAVYFYFFSA